MGVIYGYGDDGILELQHNARYLFEQTALPSTLYEHDELIIDFIKEYTEE